MKDLRNLGFGNIVMKNEDDLKEIYHSFIQAYEINKKYFSNDIKDVKIIIAETEEEFKDQAGRHYIELSSGITSYGNKIILKSRKLANAGENFYKEYAVNELNHVFWYQNYGTLKPKWLMEGFASFVSEEYFIDDAELRKIIIKFKINSDLVEYTSIRKKLKGHYSKYMLWSNFVRFIVLRFGVDKINEFMSDYQKRPIRKNYDYFFQKHFGTNDVKLFNEYIENIRSKKLEEF